jgi:hypothetical protein
MPSMMSEGSFDDRHQVYIRRHDCPKDELRECSQAGSRHIATNAARGEYCGQGVKMRQPQGSAEMQEQIRNSPPSNPVTNRF